VSTLTPDTAVPAAPSPDLARASTRSLKAPIAFAIFTVVAAVLFVGLARDGESTFRLSTATDFFALPDAVLPSTVTGVVLTVLLAVITVVAVLRAVRYEKVPIWLVAVFGVLFLVAFIIVGASGMVGVSTALNALSNHSLCTNYFSIIAALMVAFCASVRKFEKIAWITWAGFASVFIAVFIVV